MDFSSQTPIYIQIADDIRRRVLAGELSGGDQLMSTTQYATTYRINPATANKAFNILVDEGIVEKRRGIGMFITPGANDILTTAGRTDYRAEILEPAVKNGLALGLSPDQIISLVTQIVKDRS